MKAELSTAIETRLQTLIPENAMKDDFKTLYTPSLFKLMREQIARQLPPAFDLKVNESGDLYFDKKEDDNAGSDFDKMVNDARNVNISGDAPEVDDILLDLARKTSYCVNLMRL